MRTIYRVQDKKGRGPWKPGFSDKWVEDRRDLDNLLPFYIEFPTIDLSFQGKEKVVATGCKTIEQLKRWFTPNEYKILLKYGYHAVKLKADRIIAESTIQCVFARNQALWKNVTKIVLYTR